MQCVLFTYARARRIHAAETFHRKLIEVALPLAEINASAFDKRPGIGAHPKGIHQWWARLPLPTAGAVLFASVVDAPSIHPEKFPAEKAQNAERERLFDLLGRLMENRIHEGPKLYATPRAEMLKHSDGRLPPVLDPFAGGGPEALSAALDPAHNNSSFKMCLQGNLRLGHVQ